MSQKRAVENTHRPPPSKIPVPTRKLTPAAKAESSQSAKSKAVARSHEPKATSTELEKLESLRAKLEQSANEFIRARKELEEILPADGSGEQGPTDTGSAAGLKKELKRLKELTTRVESSLQEHQDARLCSQGPAEKRSSYDFLSSI
ncbi:centromere protein R [Nelusetta ayraudi]|uniref:centromere protein R n=1 Tax=Nelusetta ayraudi TaxID=303726 RepID=UPI003F71101C